MEEISKDHQDAKREAWEARYKLAIEAARIGTFEWDMENDGFIYSDLMAACFGFPPGTIVSRQTFSDSIFAEDQETRRNAHHEALKTGKLQYEARVIWPDQSLHWLRFHGQVNFDEEGKPLRMFGTAIDITDQKMKSSLLEEKVEERTREMQLLNLELKKSEERYQQMIDEVQDYAIILLDKEGTILNWNRGAQKIKGYDDAEIIGRNFSIFYREVDKEQQLPQKLIHLAIIEGRAMHEGYRVRKDGSTFWGSIVITSLHDKAGNVIGFSKVTRDLTDKKKAEDKIQLYTAELELQNKELEQFAYIASHDLQEPLRKISVFTGFLKNNLQDREASEKYFEKIVSSTRRMSELIESVLKYSRVSTASTDRRPVDLNKVLKDVESDFELMIDEKFALIESDELPEIPAVESQMHQLFSNLIGNSLKFVSDQPKIRITYSRLKGSEAGNSFPFDTTQEYVRLIFSDNGIGFESEHAASIFNIFMRLNGQMFTGSGIGLALCKKIVENHQGFINAESAPGKGAAFFIFLPAAEGSRQKAGGRREQPIQRET